MTMIICKPSQHRLIPEQLGPFGQRMLQHRWNIAGLGVIFGFNQIHNDVLKDAIVVGRLLADEITDGHFNIADEVREVVYNRGTLIFDLERLEAAVRQQDRSTFKLAARAVKQKIGRRGLPKVFERHQDLLMHLNIRLRHQTNLEDPSERVVHEHGTTLSQYSSIEPDTFKPAGLIVSVLQYLQAAEADRSTHPLFFTTGTEKGYFSMDWEGHNNMAQERQYVKALAQRVANHALRRGVAAVVDFEGTRFEPIMKKGDPAMPERPDMILSFDLVNRDGKACEGFFHRIVARTDLNISVAQGLGVTPA